MKGRERKRANLREGKKRIDRHIDTMVWTESSYIYIYIYYLANYKDASVMT